VLATLAPCFHKSIFLGCALVSLGALEGEGDVAHPHRATTVYANAGARAGVEVPIVKPLSVRLAGDVDATLTRTTLHLDGRAAWTTPPVCGALDAAAVVVF
jgi:hypothetical protein